jgi:hypothetical protein
VTNCDSGAFQVSTTAITPTYTYYLPFLANHYQPTNAQPTGSFSSYMVMQNNSNSGQPANVSIQYFAENGTSLSQANQTTQIATNGEYIVPNPLPVGSRATGIINSDQPINVLEAEATTSGSSAYAIPSGANNTLYAPFAFNQAYGDYTTQFTVFNTGNSPITATLNFYDETGLSVVTDTLTIGAKQSYNLDQGSKDNNLPSGFRGWAQISSTNGSQLVGQVLEQSINNHFISVVAMPSSSSGRVYASAIFNHAFGGFNTGIQIVNPNPNSVVISVTYYTQDGVELPSKSITVTAEGATSIYNGDSVGSGVPLNFYGSAIIEAQPQKGNGLGLVVVVNESGPGLSNGLSENGTYLAMAGGDRLVRVPLVAHGGYDYTTGLTIQNTSAVNVSGSIQYYNLDGTAVGSAEIFNIGPHASKGIYQGAAGELAAGFYGTATITQTDGAATAGLIVTVNAVSPTTFYTYTQPSN